VLCTFLVVCFTLDALTRWIMAHLMFYKVIIMINADFGKSKVGVRTFIYKKMAVCHLPT
jgi:hypothetical protein